jgi:TRAP-type C4-dicarboxylate transport system substrate-binding protein
MFNRAFGLLAGLCAAAAVPLAASAQQAKEPLRMKFSSFTTPAHFMTPLMQDYARELTNASGGSVAVEYYGAEALGKAVETWDIVREGLADIGLFCAIYTPARFPLSLFVELPFFSPNAQTSNHVVQALLARKLINDEYKEVKLLTFYTTAPSQIFANKKLSRLEDFKGMRLTGIGPVWTRTWSLLGGQAVAMGWPDIYLSLQRGTIDAGTTSWAASKGWKWQEVAKYPTDIGIMGGFFCGKLMNNRSWNKLAPDVQSRWNEISAKYSMRFTKAYDEGDEDAKQAWRAAGREIVVFPVAEKQKLAEKLLPIWQEWVDRNEGAGKPAREIYRTYVASMKKQGQPVLMKLPGLYQN